MIWAVVLIALALIFMGSFLGTFLSSLLRRWYHINDSKTLFLLQYFEFIGIDLAVLLYTLVCERPILRSFGRRGPNGGSGNTWKNFSLGLLAGFGMNAICILAAWLHGDLDLSVGRFELPSTPFSLARCICSIPESPFCPCSTSLPSVWR